MLCERRPRGLSFGNGLSYELFPRSLTMPANLRPHSSLSLSTSEKPVLYLALELGWEGWKLAFATGLGPGPRRREVWARAVAGLMQELAEAKRRLRHEPWHVSGQHFAPGLMQEIAEAKRRLRLSADCPETPLGFGDFLH